VADDTTPTAPVPPDELIHGWHREWVMSNADTRPSRYHIAEQSAEWCHAQSFPEREELRELLMELADSRHNQAKVLMRDSSIMEDALNVRARAAAERLTTPTQEHQ
jgi:hypothetical protein